MELALRGISAAPGIASGTAVALDRPRQRARAAVAQAARGREAERARAALEASGAELQAIAAHLRESGRDDEADIVETGVLMAADLTPRVSTCWYAGVSLVVVGRSSGPTAQQ